MSTDPTPKESESLKEVIVELDQDIRHLDSDIKTLNKSSRPWPIFTRGIIGSLGAVIGATIVISLVLYVLQRLAVLPVIGEIFKLALDQLRHR